MHVDSLIDLLVIKTANLHINSLDFMMIAQLDDESTVFTTDREDSFQAPSSVIGKVVWFEDQTMTIEINGRVFNYCGVPRRVFESFKGADSKGAFFVRSIRGIFEC